MLIDVTVENIFNFKNKEHLFLETNKSDEHPDLYDVEHEMSINDDLKILPFQVIYGENGVGKTNLFKSIELLKSFIINNHTKIENRVFYDTEKPSIITCSFYLKDINKIYKYIIAYNNDLIIFESLKMINNEDGSHYVILERLDLSKDRKSLIKKLEKDYDYKNNVNPQSHNIITFKDVVEFRLNKYLGIDINPINQLFINELNFTSFLNISIDLYGNDLEILDGIKTYFDKMMFIKDNEDFVFNDYLFNMKFHLPDVSGLCIDIDRIEVSLDYNSVYKVENVPSIVYQIISKIERTPSLMSRIENTKTPIILWSDIFHILLYDIDGEFKYTDINYYKTVKNEDHLLPHYHITKNMIRMINYYKLLSLNDNDYTIFIDNFSDGLHPRAFEYFIDSFIKINSGKTNQLIITDHKTNLMGLREDILERGGKLFIRIDEISLIKEDDKSSEIINLSLYEGIENYAYCLEDAYKGNYF